MESNPDSQRKTDKDKPKKNDRKDKKAKKGKRFEIKWAVTVFICSFVITIVLSLLSNELLTNIHILLSFIILLFFIMLGVIFDIIGLAIATADEKQFHSMAARKIKSAKYAIKLIRNAEKVSSFCNDVIGDIAGIVSGATGAAIAVSLFTQNETLNIVIKLLITALIAAMTVGSKAMGKNIAINNSNEIVNIVSKIVSLIPKKNKNKS